MHEIVTLLRREPRARRFLVAHAQSALGTGAAFVALVVVAYERFESPWAIALVLLAEFLPGMAFGPLLGALGDRWPRRECAVAADVVRALAFVSLAFVDGFAPTVVLVFFAGAASAVYKPSILAALPSLVARDRGSAVTALYGALDDIGYTVGPAIAALALLLSTPETILLLDGLTFAVSALLIAGLDFGPGPATTTTREQPQSSLLRTTLDGVRATLAMRRVRIIVFASSSVVLFAGLFNVGELLLARNELGAGAAGYSILVGTYGACVALGSLSGARPGNPNELSRRYLMGLFLVGFGMLMSGLAPSFPVALATFAAAGLGNGLVVVHERVLIQRMVPDAMRARVFGMKETLVSWGFSASFLAGGAIGALLGTRQLFIVAGFGVLTIWALTAYVLAHGVPGESASLPDAGLVADDGAQPFGAAGTPA